MNALIHPVSCSHSGQPNLRAAQLLVKYANYNEGGEKVKQFSGVNMREGEVKKNEDELRESQAVGAIKIHS